MILNQSLKQINSSHIKWPKGKNVLQLHFNSRIKCFKIWFCHSSQVRQKSEYCIKEENMKYFSKKYLSLYFAFFVIGFICLQLDFHTIRNLQAKHRRKGKKYFENLELREILKYYTDWNMAKFVANLETRSLPTQFANLPIKYANYGEIRHKSSKLSW